MLNSSNKIKTSKLLQWIELSASNLKYNISLIKSFTERNVEIAALLKANAYGHGISEMAKLYYKEGISLFMVHSIDEALILKKLKLKVRIIIIGPLSPLGMETAFKNGFEVTIYQVETLKLFRKLQKNIKKPLKIHVKIETGTQRQGLHIENIFLFVKQLKLIENIKLMGISSHFANIEDTSNITYYKKQLHFFQYAVDKFLELGIKFKSLHFACSAAVFLYPETHFDIIRPGISMYGYYSSSQLKYIFNHKNSLKPVLSWKTRIAQIKDVAKNEGVGYGLTFKTSRKSRIAVLPVGYYDGYDRGLSNKGICLVHGQKAIVRGRICMNMLMIDVTDIEKVKVGDVVTLIGSSGSNTITADDLACLTNTISYEILARLNPLIPKVIVK